MEGTPEHTTAPESTEPSSPESPASASSPAAPEPTAPESTAPEPTAPEPSSPAPESTEPAPAGDDDPAAVISELSQRLAQLEQRLATSGTAISANEEELLGKIRELRDDFADWPQPGADSAFADRPQPWELGKHGLPQPGVNRDHLPGGEPDSISPVVPAGGRPLLTGGSAGEPVRALAGLLAELGYGTSISEGTNHAGAFDDSVAAAVDLFRRDWHVIEDPSQFRGDVDVAKRFVGPWTWEALERAAAR